MNAAPKLTAAVHPPTGVTTATPLATLHWGPWNEDPQNPLHDDSIDINKPVYVGLPPNADGSTPLFVQGGNDLASTVREAQHIAQSERANAIDAFPGQAVFRDAQTGAYSISALKGDIVTAGGATIGAIDGWSWHPNDAVRQQSSLQALVGGKSWIDFSQGNHAKEEPLPAPGK